MSALVLLFRGECLYIITIVDVKVSRMVWLAPSVKGGGRGA
jgi:hypothetical protein